MPYSTEIIDRGRGPEIAGTRITVYDVLDYHKHGDHHSVIAATLGISSEQVLSALAFIEGNREQVAADYERILRRHAAGHPPEVQAKVDAAQARFREKLAHRRAAKSGEAVGAGARR